MSRIWSQIHQENCERYTTLITSTARIIPSSCLITHRQQEIGSYSRLSDHCPSFLYLFRLLSQAFTSPPPVVSPPFANDLWQYHWLWLPCLSLFDLRIPCPWYCGLFFSGSPRTHLVRIFSTCPRLRCHPRFGYGLSDGHRATSRALPLPSCSSIFHTWLVSCLLDSLWKCPIRYIRVVVAFGCFVIAVSTLPQASDLGLRSPKVYQTCC